MAGASGAGQGWGPASPAAPALKVSPLFFRLGRRHPGRRPGLRGGEEPRGVQRLRHPLLPQLPGEPRPAPPRGAPSSDPPPPPPTPGPGRSRAQRLRLQLRGALPDTRWSFRVQRSPPSFHPVGGGPRPCGRAPRSPPRAQAGTEAGPSRVRGLGAPRARPRGRLCLRFFHQGWRVNCNQPGGARPAMRAWSRGRACAGAHRRDAQLGRREPCAVRPASPVLPRCAEPGADCPCCARPGRTALAGPPAAPPLLGGPVTILLLVQCDGPGAPHCVFTLHTGRRAAWKRRRQSR